ncbi:hypothetical protein MTR_5g083250 [Medicago truncatula]|uniref:Uncharacterized protein n=1 Tax=Medicago truncatula TaxID=3880 RepID=G7K290_MEDTR|nr:hypothetical protein MTR_5g083250 [Medicago truncatula]
MQKTQKLKCVKNKHGAGSNAQAPLVIEDEDAKANQNPIKRPRSSGIVIQVQHSYTDANVIAKKQSQPSQFTVVEATSQAQSQPAQTTQNQSQFSQKGGGANGEDTEPT